MAARERTLAKITVSLMGLVVVCALGNYVIIPPFTEVADKLERLQETKADKLQKIQFARKHLTRYRQLYSLIPGEERGEQSVAKDDRARTDEYLSRKIDEILTSSKFKERSVRPETPARSGRGKKKKLDVITYTLDGRGDLKDVLQFLLDTYKLDDLLYISSVALKPDKRRYSESVRATIKIQTVVIPKDPELLQLAPEPAKNPMPDGAEDRASGAPLGRLGALAMADYDRLLDWRPFDAVRPEEPLPTKPSDDLWIPPDVQDEPVVGSGSDVDRDNMIVRGFLNDSVLVINKNGGSSRNPGSRRSGQRTYFRVGQDFDGGTLEFVHRLGVVVSKIDNEVDEADQGDSSKLWIYQYDQTFSEGMLLDELMEQQREFRQVRQAMEAVKQAEECEDEPVDGGTDPEVDGEQESSNESESGN